MPDTLEALKVQLGALPIRDRAELAHYLLGSLEAEVDPDTEAVWAAELDRRVAEVRAGAVVGKPAEQVFAELRERYP